MRSRVEAIGLSALNVFDVEAEVVRSVDCLWVNLPDLTSLDFAVVIIELPIFFISPKIVGLKRICMSGGFKDHVFINIFDVETSYCFDIFG